VAAPVLAFPWRRGRRAVALRPISCGSSLDFEVATTVELDAAKVDVVEVAVDANKGATAVEVGTFGTPEGVAAG
jgi:hypothetical protein